MLKSSAALSAVGAAGTAWSLRAPAHAPKSGGAAAPTRADYGEFWRWSSGATGHRPGCDARRAPPLRYLAARRRSPESRLGLGRVGGCAPARPRWRTAAHARTARRRQLHRRRRPVPRRARAARRRGGGQRQPLAIARGTRRPCRGRGRRGRRRRSTRAPSRTRAPARRAVARAPTWPPPATACARGTASCTTTSSSSSPASSASAARSIANSRQRFRGTARP